MWNPWNVTPFFTSTDHKIDFSLAGELRHANALSAVTIGLPGLINQTMADQDTIWLSVRPHLIKTARVQPEYRKTTVNL